LEVEPVRPEWQGLRAAPVGVLADDNRRGVRVVVGGGAVHLQFDELAQPGHQFSDQRSAEGRDPLHAQAEGFCGLGHSGQQIGRELTDAIGRRFVGDDEDQAALVAEGVHDPVVCAHRGQDVLGWSVELRWKVHRDIQSHSTVFFYYFFILFFILFYFYFIFYFYKFFSPG
jgi:hypothetical protein